MQTGPGKKAFPFQGKKYKPIYEYEICILARLLAYIRQQMNPVGTPSKTDAETSSTGGSSNN